jgi:hypothetical protein
MDLKNKQRAIIKFPLLNSCTGKEIVTRLRHVYGSAVYRRTSVFRWISEVRRGNEELRNEGRPKRSDRHETDAAIRSILQEDPNVSLRTITETLSISPETIHTYMLRMGYIPKTLRWILHALICELKQLRLTLNFQ